MGTTSRSERKYSRLRVGCGQVRIQANGRHKAVLLAVPDVYSGGVSWNCGWHNVFPCSFNFNPTFIFNLTRDRKGAKLSPQLYPINANPGYHPRCHTR